MKYDFNIKVNRKNTKSVKWDLCDEEVLPMWVADMDFEAPEAVKEAIIKRSEHGIYGYTRADDSYYESIINWWKRRHGYEVKKEWINFSPGVVPAVNMLVRAFTEPGDKIIVQTPVYYPFFAAIQNNHCHVVENPLLLQNNKYVMDYEDLEKKAKDTKVKAIILCSPHNPVGRVWTKEELIRLGEICIRNNVIIIADEIHCDLVYKEYKHTAFPSIREEFAENCALCIAPSKTFNIAGIQASSVVIPNDRLREKFQNVLLSNGSPTPNLFAIEAVEAAYNYGEPWLEELLAYLEKNLRFLTDFIQEKIPELKVIKPEGTYLVWVDCSTLNMKPKELHNFFLKEAKVWFDEGYIFGSSGEGFERINIACSRDLLEESLKRIEKAISDIIRHY